MAAPRCSDRSPPFPYELARPCYASGCGLPPSRVGQGPPFLLQQGSDRVGHDWVAPPPPLLCRVKGQVRRGLPLQLRRGPPFASRSVPLFSHFWPDQAATPWVRRARPTRFPHGLGWQ
ncbi:hypothetical protein L7F22_006756 [Adiantum nelumboides]|nr:hypothetical protein [Adiantum nelumboides]